MLDIEYLDSDTKSRILFLRDFIQSSTYKEFLKYYEIGRISCSIRFLCNLINYAYDLKLLFKKLNKAASILDNEILIVYQELGQLFVSLYFNYYSLNVEQTKELIRKYFKDTNIKFNDLTVEHDKIIVIEDMDTLKEYFEI